MAHQVLRYHGPNHVPGLPASHQTDEDLALLARERGTTVEKLTQEFLSYQGNGGKPLYTLTAKGADDVPKVAEKLEAKEANQRPTSAPARKG